jgi:hypothetical protein
MTELDFLRLKIPAYADYSDEDARHLVDKQVRAYVGEALSMLLIRMPDVADPVGELLERTILLCEFTNQQLMHVLDHVRMSAEELEALHEVDHELVTVADRAVDIELDGLGDYLNEIQALFARRAQAVYTPV